MTVTDAPPAGLVHGLPELEYHALPGLSSTGIKHLLRSPAHYQWHKNNRVEKPAFDMGHAVHADALETGLDVVRIEADSWRTKAAQEARDAAHAAGKVPLLAADADRAADIARAVKAHPIAGPLLTSGQPEVSLLWTDPTTGVDCRGRLDYLRHLNDGRPAIVDVKTTGKSALTFSRSVIDYGYDTQAWHYADGYERVTGVEPVWLWVVVETEPPHGVIVRQASPDVMYVGSLKTRHARELYRDCTEAGVWPSYTPEIEPVDLPAWAVADAERKYL